MKNSQTKVLKKGKKIIIIQNELLENGEVENG